jgi:hypothetical protein
MSTIIVQGLALALKIWNTRKYFLKFQNIEHYSKYYLR